MTAAAAARSSSMQVGTMSPMKNDGSVQAGAGRRSSDTAMCERAPFAHTAPRAISPASSTMRPRSVASVIGGSAPTCAA